MRFLTKSASLKPVYEKNIIQQGCRLKVPVKLITAIFCLLISGSVTAGERTVPDMPGAITGQTNVCAFVGSGQSLTYSIDAVVGAELYLWTVPATTTIISGQGTTSITISFSNGFTSSPNKQIRVRSVAEEGNSADRILYLSSREPATPAVISGPANACLYIGTSTFATYTTSRDPNATGYIWGTDPVSTLVNHPNGAGVNDTVIRVLFKRGYNTSPVTVQSANGCGFSSARTITVSGSAPSTPGTISGPTNGCPYMLPNGAIATYSISPVTGASSYTWITPEDCEVTHPNGPGSNDITITVQYPANFVSGSISVIANSGCDESAARSLVISRFTPGTPGVITAVQKVTCPAREYTYSLPNMPSNATAVTWNVPAEALSVTGQGTAAITVAYPEPRVSGIVSATGVNNCGSSTTRQLAVNLTRCQLERSAGSTGITLTGRGVSPASQQVQTLRTDQQAFSVNIAPNPSKGSFKLLVLTSEKTPVRMQLLDLQGRELKKMTIQPGQPFTFGNDLKAGTYLLEVQQGRQKHTEKLLKL